MTLQELKARIFSIKGEKEFEDLTLEIFRHQAVSNKVYKEYLQYLGIDPFAIQSSHAIPFLPIEFFKSQTILCDGETAEVVFSSSGTTGATTSSHHVADLAIYEESFRKGFAHFYGDITEYCILALLPSYLEREGSSLVYMANDLITQSNNEKSGFYLHNLEVLSEKLKALSNQKEKVLLLGVTYALLDLAEMVKDKMPDAIIMETGGMKGKRKEMVREELHEQLCQAFGVKTMHSEYGMTELLSQAYSMGEGLFRCPPWMKVRIRDVNDPFSDAGINRTGGINVIDLANIHSCSFIATQDLGRLSEVGTFEVLGRFDNSDLRGCNLLVD